MLGYCRSVISRGRWGSSEKSLGGSLNEYYVELFLRTRREQPPYLTIDLDATADPTHGQQLLTGVHAYYDQYQYFPLLASDGQTGFPFAACHTGQAKAGLLHYCAGIGASAPEYAYESRRRQ